MPLTIRVMMNFCAVVLLAVATAAAAGPAEEFGEPDQALVAAWKKMLPAKPAGLGPRITDRKAWEEIGRRKSFRGVIDEANRLAAEPIPPMTDELYLNYSRTGDRHGDEDRSRERMHYFTTLVYAECIENRGRFLPAIERALDDFCHERTWLPAAHDTGLRNFKGEAHETDIISSAKAWNIATAAWWLGDRLDQPTRDMLADNFEQRVFQHMTQIVKYGKPRPWWLAAKSNHNSVTLAGVIGVAMAQMESRDRRAWFAAAAEKFIGNYLDTYTPDGYCTEGIGYWNYGFSRYVMLADELRIATDGKVDWLADPRIEQLARFGRRMEIQDGRFPTFSDCSTDEQAQPALMCYLSRRYGWGLMDWEQAGAAEARAPQRFLFAFALYGDMPEAPEDAAAPHHDLPERDYFPEAGVLICRPSKKGTMGVAIKGGNNGDKHNHNDVGTFIVVVRDKPQLVDPGAEDYTSRTFSRDRYDSDVLNSFGHSVPRVAGQLQATGREAQGTIVETDFSDDVDRLKMDITAAYDVDDLEQLTRSFSYSRKGDGSLTVSDEVRFATPQRFETALVTFSPWKKVSDNRLLIGTGPDAVVVDLAVEGSPFIVTSSEIEEDLPGKEKPIRIAIELTEPVEHATVTATIRPAGAN